MVGVDQRNIVVAIDTSKESFKALHFVCKHLIQEHIRLHVLTVLPPAVATVAPCGPIASAGAVTAVTAAYQAQEKADKAAAQRTLKQAEELCATQGISAEWVSYHTLPPAGGACGIAESVVRYVAQVPNALLVLGHRGLGSIQRAMMSVLGLGSVSEYCTHSAICPVLTVKGSAALSEEAPMEQSAPFKLALCVDDSQHSSRSVAWAMRHLVRKDMQVHVISVALAVSLPIVDDTTADIAGIQARQWEREKQVSQENAEGVCARALELISAAGNIKEEQLYWKSLAPEGGASDVAASIIHYCKDNSIDLCVVGSHGFGAMTRALRSFVGLGSVADYCLHKAPRSVCVVKAKDLIFDDSAAPEPAAPSVAAAQEPEGHEHTS